MVILTSIGGDLYFIGIKWFYQNPILFFLGFPYPNLLWRENKYYSSDINQGYLQGVWIRYCLIYYSFNNITVITASKISSYHITQSYLLTSPTLRMFQLISSQLTYTTSQDNQVNIAPLLRQRGGRWLDQRMVNKCRYHTLSTFPKWSFS